MKVSMEKIEKNKVALEVEVAADKFSKAMDQAYKKVVTKVNIPGFRKGKVPRAILEQQYGKEILFEEAADILLPDAYFQAVQETKIDPIDKPQVEIVQLEDGKPFIFKATVEVKPEVTLGQYTEIAVEKSTVEVTEEQVQARLADMQQKGAEMVALEDEAAQTGDIAVIDYEGYIEDVQFEGGTGTGHPLELGSGSFIPGFEEQLIGAKAGDEIDVKISFPEDYHSKDHAGKEAVFKVKVNAVKRKQIATLDDEFAKDVSEFETLEELKQDIKNKLEVQAEQAAENQLRASVIDQVVANAEVEVPEVMIQSRLEEMINDMGQRLQSQGMSLEDYFKFTNSSKEQLMETHREDAAKGVKTDLVLEAVKSAENIEATEEEVNEEIEKLATQYNQKADVMKSILEGQGNVAMFENSIAMEKTIKFLLAKANIA